mmetsp:Transcript_8194/g.50935  ORF Transcript_8194/g.50935 Transcript_8194/m.50935 type:complete len:97 (-) Transcript_8194:3873-4163(-)
MPWNRLLNCTTAGREHNFSSHTSAATDHWKSTFGFTSVEEEGSLLSSRLTVKDNFFTSMETEHCLKVAATECFSLSSFAANRDIWYLSRREYREML